MQNKIRIPIGDWSGDGHNDVEWFVYMTNKNTKDIREAYFKAKEILDEKLCPENFACDYEISSISITHYEEILKKFPALTNSEVDIDKSKVYLNPDFMAAYVVEFLKVGDPDLQMIETKEDVDMLPFYGYDEKNRHISFIGYGVTGNY